MSQQAARFVKRLARDWPPPQWREVNVLAAVSGGADSVALLHGLRALKHDYGGSGVVHAAHVNHGLRGGESQRQQAWVERLAQRLKTPLAVECCQVADRAAAEGDGIEAAARAERYAALSRIAHAVGARFVVTGHTRDDQVETVVMRLLRGTGLRGLGGMQRVRPLADGVSLLRPLLDVARADVEAYLTELGQDWFHDSSNDESRFTRNRVRHDLLPMLRAASSGDFDAAMVNLAAEARAAADAAEADARSALDEARLVAAPSPGRSGEAFRLGLAKLRSLSAAVQTETLRLAWRDAGLPEQAMTRRHWTQLADLVRSEGSAPVNLPGNLRGRVADGVLLCERMTPAPASRRGLSHRR